MATSDYLKDARIVVVGAGAIGTALSYRLALLVTEELTGGDTAPLEEYRPARFALGAGRPSRQPATVGSSD